MASTKFDVVIPLINKSCRIATKVPLSLTDNVSIHTIRASDLVTISAEAPSSRAVVNGNTKVILISNLDEDPKIDLISLSALGAIFIGVYPLRIRS